MKNKYGFWKLCLISLAGLAGLTGLTGCKEISCEFSYTPTEPLAGGIVTFVNQSVGADDYQWTFGDNGTATASSPTHIYRKPGTYTVTLQIKRNKVQKRSCTHQIVIYDTVPSIGMSADSIYAFTPITLSAQVYNPWKKAITCHWTLPKQAVVMSWASDSTSVKCYFDRDLDATTIRLDLQQGDIPYAITRTETVYHSEATSLLFRKNSNNYEQFIYSINGQWLYQEAQITRSEEAQSLLDKEQDTTAFYEVKLTKAIISERLGGQPVNGFQLDRATTKIYAYNSDSLWVSNLYGAHQRTLHKAPIQAIKVDGASNRLYWASNQGLFTGRLLQISDNSDHWTKDTVNTTEGIKTISVNLDKH